MVNYFSYDYNAPEPADEHPFHVNVEVHRCPWQPRRLLARVALQGMTMDVSERPAANLVFLLDVSGSMRPDNKLPLLKQAMKLLTNELAAKDRVAIVVYAGASGLVLDSTAASNRQAILEALDRLRSGGSTNGGAGIELAYRIATEQFIKGGINRVILATDGDFNVGVTDRGSLTRLIENKAKTGVFLTILGFGGGNLKDATMEELSNKGNGNYAYIDSLREARKVLIEQMGGTLATIAKDVKIQVEFNPAEVKAYRLVGYENRLLAKEDFNDDTKDAGEIGAGHTVTALYELVPAGVGEEAAALAAADRPDVAPGPETTTNVAVAPEVDALRYQTARRLADAADSGELMTVKLRYKAPDAPKEQGTSKLVLQPVHDMVRGQRVAHGEDYQWAASVAAFGMLLRDSPYKGEATFEKVAAWAEHAIGHDPHGHRAEFIELVHRAKELSGEETARPRDEPAQ